MTTSETPKGVEHKSLIPLTVASRIVTTSETPKGVEHSGPWDAQQNAYE